MDSQRRGVKSNGETENRREEKMAKNDSDPGKREKCLDFVMFLFRMGGCWPSWNRKREWREKLYILYSASVFATQFVSTIILFYGLVLQSQNGWKTLEDGVEDVVVFSTIFLVFVKMVLILRHHEELRELYNGINRNMYSEDFLCGESRSIVESCIKHERRLVRWFSLFGHSTTALYTVSSIITISRSWDSSKYPLPLKYPFQPTGRLFVLTYLYQLVSMIACAHIGTLVDSLFSCFAYYISIQFEILSRRVKNEGKNMSKKFVVHHNHVIRMVEKMESIYGVFLTFELTITSALLCLGMVQVTQTRGIHLLFYLKCLVYVSGKLVQMVLYCWYGDRVIEKSASISHGAYFGSWYERRNKKIAHHLTMIMLRSQKSVVIRGGSYIRISLPTMAAVINTAYTLFTMLRSFR